MSCPVFPQDIIDQIREDYANGIRQDGLSKRYKASKHCLAPLLKGIKPPPPGINVTTKIDKEECKRLFLEGWKPHRLAKKYKVATKTICNLLVIAEVARWKDAELVRVDMSDWDKLLRMKWL